MKQINITKAMTKEAITQIILENCKDNVVDCTKMSLSNIVLSLFGGNIPLADDIFCQVVKTKEQPNGQSYDAKEYHVVLRIVDGMLMQYVEKNDKKQPDVYAWDTATYAKKMKTAVPIGYNGIKARRNMRKMLRTLTTKDDRKTLKGFFKAFRFNFDLVFTPEEARKCIVVTQELYDAGLQFIIDEWVQPNDDGTYNVTELAVGDVIILNEGIYCCEKNVFEKTYKF